MNIESRRCSNEINQIDYIFSYLISQYTINSNLNNLMNEKGRFVGGTVNENQTIKITEVTDSWSKNYVLFTGRYGMMGSIYYRDFEGITPLIENPDINAYLNDGYLYIRNNSGLTIQYGIIKIQ